LRLDILKDRIRRWLEAPSEDKIEDLEGV